MSAGLLGSGSGSVSVTAVLGVGSSSPHCYVLRVEDWSLLLDCGWNAAMDEALFSPTACALLASVDCVLLSHSSFRHCGALPYVRRRLALSCPVYATLPVARMGAMTLYDHYQQHVAGISPPSMQPPQQSGEASADSELYSLDDIDGVFDSMRLLKYSEELPLSDHRLAVAAKATSKPVGASAASASASSSRVVISPHASGHSVGGCVWRIVCEGAVLLYAVDYNHKSERHLEGGLLEAFTRPSLLVMDCASLAPPPALSLPGYPAAAAAATSRKVREARLLDLVLGCVNGGGVCLLPVDSAGRVLELLALLHLTWEASRMYERVPLLFASPQSATTVEFAQQQVEWLSDAMQKHLNTERSNPFHLPHLHTVTDLPQLDALTQHCTRPAVILATSHTLQPNSLAMAVLERIASQPASLVVLTQDLEQGTVASDLFSGAARANGSPFALSVRKPTLVALEGDELRQHLLRAKVREEQRLMENSQQTAMDEQQSDDDDGRDNDDRDADEQPSAALAAHQQHGVKQLNPPTVAALNYQSSHSPAPAGSATSLPSLLTSAVLSASALSHSSASFPPFYQFPFADARRQSDLYGEMIEHHPRSHQQQPQSSSGQSNAPPPHARNGGNEPPPRAPSQAAAHPTSGVSSPSVPSFPSHSTPAVLAAAAAAPTRCVWVAVSVSVSCGVSYVDFRGVSEAKDWKNIVSHVKPRKLLLVHGQEDDKVAFRHYCIDKRICAAPPAITSTSNSATASMALDASKAAINTNAVSESSAQQQQQQKYQRDEASTSAGSLMDAYEINSLPGSSFKSSSAESAGVLIAAVLSPVDISSELSYRFGMAPSLLARLRFARVTDYEVAQTTAVVLQTESAVPQLVSVDGGSFNVPGVPHAALSLPSRSSSVFLGDYRFADFRRVLASAGIDSEFYVKGGVLVAAGGRVRIRKSSPNTLTVQGVVSEQFYTVRALLYSQYSVVTPQAD